MPYLKIRAMSSRFLAVLGALLSFFAAWTDSGCAETVRESINPGVPWPATDALGRELPLAAEVGLPKKDRFVGIFYLPWTGDEYSYGPYDVSKILAGQPDMRTTPTFRHSGPKQWHYAFWGEPLFGYYKLTDPWVIRRHMHLLAAAGVDTLVVDATNAEIYENVLNQFLPVLLEIRKEGGRTPQVCFMLNTDMGNIAMQLLEKFYRPGRFDELWFRWEGKPLMLCNPDAAMPEVRRYFTLRTAFWPGTPPYKNTPYAWHWLGVHPQAYGFTDDPGAPEQVNVSPAQNMHWETGALELMWTGKARGRGFSKGKQDPSIGAIQRGLNFQEQWDYALKIDPKFVMITAWNEWVAGLTHSMQTPWVQCDGFNEEFSRDIEPMKGGFGDNFYYQAVGNIRRFKGVPEIPKASAAKTIDIGCSFDQWQDVAPDFRGIVGHTTPRNHDGFGRASKTRVTRAHPDFEGNGTTWRGEEGLHYTNKTGRNGFLFIKVCRDEENVYFYVRTEKPITPPTDPNWMTLLIRTGNPENHTWDVYDYVLNRVPPTPEGAVLEKNTGVNSWLKAGNVKFRVEANEMHIAVPRSLLRLTGEPLTFDFKWLDNIALPLADDLSLLYVQGDAAPLGRFRFRYTAE
ncbi:MAG: hypothetical protein RIQ71_56 [Verrucomicrobiota bacterium]|jgi:hypothetical protein